MKLYKQMAAPALSLDTHQKKDTKLIRKLYT